MILRDDSQLGDVGVAELHCIISEGGLVLLINKTIAAIVVEGGSDIKSFTRAELPQFAVVRLGVDEDVTTYRSDGRGVLVVGEMEVIPDRKMRFKGGLLGKLEGEICLWEQIFPKVVRERWVNPCQDGEEVGLEGTY